MVLQPISAYGVAIAVWFCLLPSGWRVLGRLVTLPEDRVAFVAVGAFVLEPAVGPRSAGLTLWVEGKAVSEGECMPFWGLEASLGRLFGPWAGGSAVPPRNDWLPPRGLRSFWSRYWSRRSCLVAAQEMGGAPFLFWTAGHMSASRSFVSLCSWCYVCTLGAPMSVRLALPWIGLAPGKRL